MSATLGRRAAGVLLHPTSLPGPGIGSLGAAARRFVEWLEEAGQSYWQILPLVAVAEGGSPYNGLSAMAGNPLLIDLEELVRLGLLEPADLRGAPDAPDHVDYPAVGRWKTECLERAHGRWRAGSRAGLSGEFEAYRREEAAWLDDFALFRVLRDHHGRAPWTEWEPGLRDRDPGTLALWRARFAAEVERTELEQFLFDRQWSALRGLASAKGIRIIGDIPIFVDHNSADVWAQPDLFRLDARGEPEVVSGVPPDYFSETGQRWGNPLYRWDEMRSRGYEWWVRRVRRTLRWVDLVRIDHFRGFEAYWEIDAAAETALEGHWRPGPGADLFDALRRRLGPLPVIAEDLGLITSEVEALRDGLGFPGMRVLQFAFDGDAANPHLPENHPEHAVAYTGTHDNDTALGWWRGAEPEERRRVRERAPGIDADPAGVLMELALASPARLAVVPLQDALGLGSEARMNTPGTAADNWTWRFRPEQLDSEAAARLREAAAGAERLAPTAADAHTYHQGENP